MLGVPFLTLAHMQAARLEVNLLPAQIHHFGRPQSMPVGQKHHEGVAVAIPVLARRLDQLLHLAIGQVLRVRSSAFFGRRGATVRFSVIGATNRSFGFAMTYMLPLYPTVHILDII